MKKLLKKSLALFLSLIMLMSIAPLSGIAATEKTSSSKYADTYIVVPEIIYLSASKANAENPTYTAEYYVNNTFSNSTNAITLDTSNAATTGKVYFKNTSAESVTIDISAVDGGDVSYGGISGGTNTLSSGYGEYTLKSLSLGKSVAAGGTTQIKWTFTASMSDGSTAVYYAYSTCYAPWYTPVGVGAEIGGKYSTHTDVYNSASVWFSGVHGYNSTYGYSKPGDASKTNKKNEWWLPAYAKTSGNNIVPLLGAVTGSSSGTNNIDGWISKTADSSTTCTDGTFVCAYRRDNRYFHNLILNGYTALLTVDTSRNNNLNQIPDFTVGMLITDMEGGQSGINYIVDFTGYSRVNGFEESDTEHKASVGASSGVTGWDERGTGNYILNEYSYSGRLTGDAGLLYNGVWNKAIAGSSSSYAVKAGAFVYNDNKSSKYNQFIIHLDVTNVNKSSLRAKINEYIKTGFQENWTIESDKWNTYQTALKNAYNVLGTPTATQADVNAALSALTNAKNALVRWYYVVIKKYDGTTVFEGHLTENTSASELKTKAGSNTAAHYDNSNHYTYSWPTFSNVTTEATYVETRSAAAHSYTYEKIDDNQHRGTCSCGHSIVVSHSWDGGNITTPVTCTSNGVRTYNCSICNGTKTEPIATTGHSATEIPARTATCTAPGNNAYWYCSKCNKYYSDAACTQITTVDAQAIPATGHRNTTTINAKDATCSSPGYTGDTYCNDCKTTIATGSDIPSNAGNHVDAFGKSTLVKHEAAASNCINTGNIVYWECTGCSKLYSDADASTLTDIESVTVGLSGHTWTNTKKYVKSAATCTADAVYYQECSVCHISSKDNGNTTWTDADSRTGHNFNGSYVSNENGTHSRLCVNDGCTVKGYNGVENASADCGNWVYAKKDADKHTKTCQDCGYSKDVEHSWDDGVQTKAPSCTEVGKKKYTCDLCGEEKTEDIPVIAHTINQVAENAPDCENDGNIAHWTCSVCKKLFSDEAGTNEISAKDVKISATGHNFTGGYVQNGDGFHSRKCVNTGCTEIGYNGELDGSVACSDWRYEKVDADTHKKICKNCAYQTTEGHAWNDGVQTTAPTCEAFGVKTYTCTLCNETKTEDIPICGKGCRM